MKLLFTGRGGAGSWTVRGEQLGAACGGKVKANASRRYCEEADLIIVVKRTPDELLEAVRASGKPWVYDVVDCYPQPMASLWKANEAASWVRQRLEQLKPSAVIWPNHRMGQDCSVDLPSMVLPHHYRPGIEKNPIRDRVKKVGYEGASHYLQDWGPDIEKECEKRGWQFVVNPSKLADVDIVVAVRGGMWSGYVPRHWKSNVKLANCHGSGTPFIGQQECGYMETESGAEYWLEEKSGLGMCFDWLTPRATRQQVQDRFLRNAYSVDKAAEDLKAFLHGL